jgi:hypothetical protein
MERRPTKVAAVALANKMARIAWAIVTTARDTSSQSCCQQRKTANRPIGKGMKT